MKSVHLFLMVVAIYFAGLFLKIDALSFIFKPLLISTLLYYFIRATRGITAALKKWVIGALFFSVWGDSLLLFASREELFFLLGLGAFLIAHIFYILGLHTIRARHKISGKWYSVVLVGAYYFFIIYFLLPHLGVLKYPVIAYGLVISFMLLVALNLQGLRGRSVARCLITGALLFVASDSMLALNRFYQAFRWGPELVMTTYVLAQWLLVRGMVLYLRWEHQNRN